ncbi:hypothetical protein H8957_001131 [Semnopithecus entellus]
MSFHRSAPAQPPAEGTEGTAPGGGPPGPPPNLTSNRRLQQTQAQVEEVVDIIRVNVDKVLERDQKLSELDDRADALQAGASQFESSAAKLKRKYWWKNCKVNFLVPSSVFSWASPGRRQENSQLLHFFPLMVQHLSDQHNAWEEIPKASF